MLFKIANLWLHKINIVSMETIVKEINLKLFISPDNPLSDY